MGNQWQAPYDMYTHAQGKNSLFVELEACGFSDDDPASCGFENPGACSEKCSDYLFDYFECYYDNFYRGSANCVDLAIAEAKESFLSAAALPLRASFALLAVVIFGALYSN